MKRPVSIILGFTLLFGICACGNKTEPGKETLTWQEQYDLGLRYLEEGNYEEAILAFTVAIEIDPKQAFSYVGRGDAYVLSGETEENLAAAQVDYEKAIELDERFVEAYLGLADVYIYRGNYDKALEILQQGLEKVGDNQKIVYKITEIEIGDGDRPADTYGNCWKSALYVGDKMQRIGPNGVFVNTIETTAYNDNGLPAIMELIDGYMTIRYEWNEKGQIIQMYWQKSSGSAYIFFDYDEQGRIISMTTNGSATGSTGNWEARGFEYDERGRVVKYDDWFEETIEALGTEGAEMTSTRLITYDEDGRTSRIDAYMSYVDVDTYIDGTLYSSYLLFYND